MSENKRTVDRYLAGFRVSDHPEILSCLTDDVEWEIPGVFHSRGKAAFDKEIENEAFVFVMQAGKIKRLTSYLMEIERSSHETT